MVLAMTKAAIYARVSTREQAEEGFSIEAQLKRLRAYCRSRSWEISGEYVDKGRSGRTDRRPEYSRMIDDIESWDVLAVLKIDRIHRNIQNHYKMCQFLKAHKKDMVAVEDSYDTTTAWGRFALDVLARIAQLESERTGERVKMGMEQAMKKGIWMGTAPYGYRRSLKGNLVVCE